jgi:hypothetical protein
MLHAIASFVAGALAFVGSLFGGPVQDPTLGVALPSGAAVFETSLQDRISSTDTSMVIVSATARGGGTLSGYQCFTIDEGRSDAEFVCGTLTGTTLSSLERGLDPLNGTSTVAALKFTHRKGANVKITDFPLLQRLRNQVNGAEAFETALSYASALSFSTTSNQIPSALWVSGVGNTASTSAVAVIRQSANTFSGSNTFSAGNTFSATTTLTGGALVSTAYRCTTESDANQLCEKAYIDSVAIAGASNANTTTKGIVEEATQSEVNAGTATGGTAARLFVNPSTFEGAVAAKMAFYNATSSGSNVYVIGISVTANDVLQIWAQFDKTSDNCTPDSSAMQGVLLYKQSTMAASTTISTIKESGDGAGSLRNCNAVAIGLITATTTQTINVSAEPTNATYASLIVQHFIR